MKKSIVLAMLGIVLMLGLVSCQQEEPWTDGAPSDMVGKLWTEVDNDGYITYTKWLSNGQKQIKSAYSAESAKTKAWKDTSVLTISKYRGNEIQTTNDTTYTYSISGRHLEIKGGIYTYSYDQTDDVVD